MGSSIALSSTDRMREVISHLPPGPFSLRDFTDHATGLNAVDNLREVEPFLEQLIAEHTIARLGKNTALWVVVGSGPTVAT